MAVKVKISKLPPEANELAKKIEDALTHMSTMAIKSMTIDNPEFRNLEITVYENLFKLLSTSVIVTEETI
jgi:hypothetical protein